MPVAIPQAWRFRAPSVLDAARRGEARCIDKEGQAMGRWRVGATVALLGAGVALVTGSASAFDINGTWEGKITCKGIFDGAPQTLNLVPTVYIDDSSVLQIAVDGLHFSAVAFFNPDKPDKGELAIIRCDTNGIRSSGEFGGEFGRLKVSTKAGKQTGSISGTSYRASVLVVNSVYTCKWSLKRSTIDHPTLGSCSTPQAPG
jgi:hypothetical protein